MRIRRFTKLYDAVSVTASAATSGEIDCSEAAAGLIVVPAGSGLTALTFHAAIQPGNAALPLNDNQGLAVTLTVAAGQCYPLPEACGGAGAVRITANTTGTLGVALKG